MRVAQAVAKAIPAVREALAHHGFGVLTEIDVQATMRSKLDVETGPYVILGACNPALAYRALGIEPSLGLLLPCNVIVREVDGNTLVEAIDPNIMTDLSGNTDLAAIAAEAATRLRAALAELSD